MEKRDIELSIEDQKAERQTVYLNSLLCSSSWQKSCASIPVLLGRDVADKVVIIDLAEVPHLLIGGATGSGKSVCMNAIIMSMLSRFTPDRLKFIMIDPKVVEFEMYRSLPHLITPVVNNPRNASYLLNWCINEIERRYKVLENIWPNSLSNDVHALLFLLKLPILVVAISDLSDLMVSAKDEVERSLCHIAQKGHAVGIHLLIMTSALRKDVITEPIKENIPARIAFYSGDEMGSHLVLDSRGAEKLLGNGDMLFKQSDVANLKRIQGAYISDLEIDKICKSFWGWRQSFDIANQLQKEDVDKTDIEDGDCEIVNKAKPDIVKAVAEKYMESDDHLIMLKAIEIIINAQQVSTSYLQRNLHVGYNKAAEIIDKLEQRHIISAPQGTGQQRTVLIIDEVKKQND